MMIARRRLCVAFIFGNGRQSLSSPLFTLAAEIRAWGFIDMLIHARAYAIFDHSPAFFIPLYRDRH